MTIQMQFLVAALLFIISWHSSAQTTFQRTFGGSGYDWGYSVEQTSDSGYVIAATFDRGGRCDVYLIKTNAYGDTLWTKTFGGSGGEEGFSVHQTSDGGYVVAGSTYSFGAGGLDVYLIKTNAAGDTLWTKTFGGTGQDEGYSVQQTSDGGYVIAGLTYSFGAAPGDVYLIKTNAGGDTVWTKTFGGSNQDFGYSVRQTSDSGYVIVGITLSFGAGGSDVWLIKTNSVGDTLWTRTFGGSNYDRGYSVQQTSDGGYVIAGMYDFLFGPSNIYLIKTNAAGGRLWTRTFGNTYGDPSVEQTSDGGYIIAASLYHAGDYNAYLIKTNVSGDTLWTKTFGGSNYDEGFSVQQTRDGGYIVAGVTASFGAGLYDVYLIKTNANGVVPVPEEASTPTGFALEQNYPNPFNPSTTIGFEIPVSVFVSLKVYNVLGQEVATLVNDVKQAGRYEVIWNASEQASGVYFCSLQAGEFFATKKLIVIR